MEIAKNGALRYPIGVNEAQFTNPARQIFKPSQLNALAKDLLESNFSQIWLEGEISNLSRPASGHLYFTIKDSQAQIRCAMFRNKAMYLNSPIQDGQQVLLRARLTLYEARGDYQLAVEAIEPAGLGALQIAFEQLKKRLDAEGLFSQTRKKTLPAIIQRLAILTSPRGAALHDVLSVMKRRFPLTPIELWPIPVQGMGAANEILNSLNAALASKRYDAILITRGGGSLEDLWAFNDATLVRAVANSTVPIVSAIGHEVDFCLMDFAADLRAATPSAAAELLTPSADAMLVRIHDKHLRLQQRMQQRLQQLAQRCDLAYSKLQTEHPAQRLRIGREKLLQMQWRLHQTIQKMLLKQTQAVRTIGFRLNRQDPQQFIPLLKSKLNAYQQSMHMHLQQQISQKLFRLKQAGSNLNALSPLATVQRGYSILRDSQSQLIQSVHRVQIGDTIHAQLSDGNLQLEVKPNDQHQ